MLHRQGVTQVIFDKDRGLEILVRALGGEYLPLKNGAPTGFNPLQLEPTPGHLEFLKSWLRALACCGGRPTLLFERVLTSINIARDTGVWVCALVASRVSSSFSTPRIRRGCLHGWRVWCAVSQGDYAWVFDNPEDLIVANATRTSGDGLRRHRVSGQRGDTRFRLTLYLFHLVRQLLDGRRLVCWMDEFWRLLADPAFEGFAKDGPKDLAEVEWCDVPGPPRAPATCSTVPSVARSSNRHRQGVSSPTPRPAPRIYRRLRAH